MIRVRGPIVGLWAIGLALAGLAAWGGAGPRGARPVFLEVDAEKDATLSITWAGDTMIADGAKPYVADHGFDWVFERLAVPDADVVIVNHEAPLTSRNAPLNPNKTYSYMSDPAASQALAAAGVTVLGLANNHALDMGPAGLADTMRHAEAAGLVTFGAGMNDREAERPLIVRGGGVTVGIVALGRGYGTKVTAGRKRAGTVPLSARSIKRGYELARKAGAEHVVAYVHWGANYQGVIEEQRLQAAAFAEAGYDLVVGHGPHVPQPAEVLGSTPVFYSLGNFVFGAPGRFSPSDPPYGLVLTTEYTASGLTGITVECLEVDNRRVTYQPRPCDLEEAAAVLDRLGVTAVTRRIEGSRGATPRAHRDSRKPAS